MIVAWNVHALKKRSMSRINDNLHMGKFNIELIEFFWPIKISLESSDAYIFNSVYFVGLEFEHKTTWSGL